MDFELYMDALKNLLQMKFIHGELIAANGKRIKNKGDADTYIASVVYGAQLRGTPDPASPYYYEVMSYITPVWEAEQAEIRAGEEAKAREEFQKDWANMLKSQSEDQWRRYKEEVRQAERREDIRWREKQEARDWGFKQAEWGTKLQRAQESAGLWRNVAEAGRIQREVAGMEGVPTFAGGAANQRWLSEQFETMRQTLLGSLTGDRDWIKRQQVQLAPNRWQGATVSPTERIEDLKATETYLKDAIKRSDVRAKDTFDGYNLGDEQVAIERQNLQNALQEVESQIGEAEFGILPEGARTIATELGLSPLAAYRTAGRYAGNIQAEEFAGLSTSEKASLGAIGTQAGFYGGWTPPPQTGVEVPKFLPQFVPGLTKFIPGTGTTPGKAPKSLSPSGQLWSRTSPTQRQKWAGYAEFVGQSPEDLLWEMERRKPQPTRGTRWQAPIQWR